MYFNGKVDRQAIRKLFIDKRDDKIQHKRWELENLIDKEILFDFNQCLKG